MLKQMSPFVVSKLKQLSSLVARCQSSNPSPDSLPRQFEKSINQVTLLGRVGAEPQKRGSEKHPVIIFSLATNTRYDNEGEVTSKAEWHRISVFRPNLRDIVYTYLQKGQRVYVTGRLSYGEIKDEAGNTRSTTSIIAEDIVLFRSND